MSENEQRVAVCIVLQEGQLSDLASPSLIFEPGTAEESENPNTFPTD